MLCTPLQERCNPIQLLRIYITQLFWDTRERHLKFSGQVYKVWTECPDGFCCLLIYFAVVLSDLLIKSFECLKTDVTIWLSMKRSILLTGLIVEFCRCLRTGEKNGFEELGFCFSCVTEENKIKKKWYALTVEKMKWYWKWIFLNGRKWWKNSAYSL